MSSSLQQKIAFLYPKRAEEVYQRLRQILKDFINTSEVLPKYGQGSVLSLQSSFTSEVKEHSAFSEKEVVLICYPDHVGNFNNHLDHGRGQVGTLKVLHRFLKKYARGLVNRIHLLPFYPYSSDEGFSVIDYYQVKKEFGDWEDVKKIGEDFGLMFDFVLNHVSSKSQWFQRFLAGESKFADYFIAFDKKVDTSLVYRPRTNSLLTSFSIKKNLLVNVVSYQRSQKTEDRNQKTEDGGQISDNKSSDLSDLRLSSSEVSEYFTKHLWTTFSPDQIDLNFQNPEVLLEMIKVFLFYIRQGASAVRLDAVRYLWKELGTSCVDLPQTHAIVKLLRQILQELDLGVWLTGEVKGSQDTAFSYLGNGRDETHLIYNFQLPVLLLSAFFKSESTELTKWARDLKTPSSETTFFNVTATHDGIGLTPLAGFMSPEEIAKLVDYALESKGLVNYHSVGEKLKPYELNIVYLNALGGVKPFLASQAIQLSLQGVPGIYFNSLIGGENWLEGVKKLGDKRAINREKFDYQKLVDELENKQSTKHQVYSAYRKLLLARINEPLFSPLSGQEIINLHPKIFAVLRLNGQERLLSLTNVSSQNVEIATETMAKILEKNQVRDLISGQEINLKDKNFLLINPYQSFWWK